jgi:RimJ/RimL family protein N-acetyltransferase
MAAVDHWPMFGLGVLTPLLELRYPDDELTAALAELAVLGIHEPGARPFLRQWEYVPPPHQQRNTLQHQWGQRATWTPTDWKCDLVALRHGSVAGVQSMWARDFATRRTVETGSWLGLAHQGQGLGTEMRAAALHLAFSGLDAVRAESGAWHDNAASMAVSRKLGYEPNGDGRLLRAGVPDTEIRLVLSRQRWEQRRRDDIEIVGLEPCLPFFGAVEADWLLP